MEGKKPQIYQVDVHVTAKDGVPDPFIPALTDNLHELGFNTAKVLRVGKTVRLFIGSESSDVARETAIKASEELLANKVYQQYEVVDPMLVNERDFQDFNL